MKLKMFKEWERAYKQSIRHAETIINNSTRDLEELRTKVERPTDDKLRPAVASDIVIGAFIWNLCDDGWIIMKVDEVIKPSCVFKGFIFNGCRYGLEDSFVEID